MLPRLVASAPRKPKISILLITYNHEKYIAQAIEGILMQETEYEYEINVIEDCSTDKTQEVVMRYVEKYPHIVKPYFNKKNIGHKVTQKNFYRGFKTMSGEYLAILEGDDYWTSPHKLQKQVAFLEANLDFAICAHNTVKVYEDGSQAPHRFLYWGQQPDKDIQDAVRMRSFFHTTGLIYRNVFKGIPPKQFRNKWSCDIFIFIAHAQFGKIHHLDEDMAIYRAHSTGRFSTMPLTDAWMFNIEGLRRYNAWLNYRYLTGFSEAIARYCASILSQAGTEVAPPLSALHTVKIYGLMLFYGSIAYVLGLGTRINQLREVRGNGLLNLLLSLAADASRILYKLARHLAPESLRLSILKFDAKHEDVRHLRYLASEGRLLTRHGLFHFMAITRRIAAKATAGISRALYWLGRAITPKPMLAVIRQATFKTTGVVGGHRIVRWLTRPIRLDSATTVIRRFGASHADIGHIRFLIKDGRLFTSKGIYHVIAFERQVMAEIVVSVSRLPYRLGRAITPEPIKAAIRRFEASHAGIRQLHVLISEGRVLSRTGLRHLFAVMHQAAFKILARVRNGIH
jgi:glycosyltransferase involved in cell wall biosynthesis